MVSSPPIVDAPVEAPIYLEPGPGDHILDGTQWASSTPDDPWDPVLLALDGGGIRGYTSLIILEAVMEQVAVWESKLRHNADALPPVRAQDLLPCHYFDFIYGTSTGGLIATMLGRLRMSIPQCLDIYRRVGESLFGRQRSRVPLTTKYHHRPLQDAVKEIVRSHCKQHLKAGECDGEDWFPWDSAIENRALVDFNNHICQAICLTAVHNGRIDEAHLLRTYDHRYVEIPNWISPYNEGADKLKIWQVTRATSAAPFYFDLLEAKLDDQHMGFKDGGIRENNPSGAAWSEYMTTHDYGRDPSLLLSVGTGRSDQTQDGFASAWPGPFGHSSFLRKAAEKFAVLRNVLIKYTDGEDKHKDMRHLARGEHTWYKRLNVSTGLENMPLDDWRRGMWHGHGNFPGGASLTRMEEATSAYLKRDLDKRFDSYAPPRTVIDQVAEHLVRQRLARERSKDMAPETLRRWETYTGHYLTGDRLDSPDKPLRHSIPEGLRGLGLGHAISEP